MSKTLLSCGLCPTDLAHVEKLDSQISRNLNLDSFCGGYLARLLIEHTEWAFLNCLRSLYKDVAGILRLIMHFLRFPGPIYLGEKCQTSRALTHWSTLTFPSQSLPCRLRLRQRSHPQFHYTTCWHSSHTLQGKPENTYRGRCHHLRSQKPCRAVLHQAEMLRPSCNLIR